MINELNTDKVTYDPASGQRFVYLGAGHSETTLRADSVRAPNARGTITYAQYKPTDRTTNLFFNLRDNPRATIKQGRDVRGVVAREVDGAERDRLWALVTREFPLYETYQRRTSRRIPLFVLEPDRST